MAYTIASWNIEKNGASSSDIKQTKVSDFIEFCCKNIESTVIFLCEVHKAQISNYIDYMSAAYGSSYDVVSLPGGFSNAYVLLYRRNSRIEVSQDTLKGLNRGMFVLTIGGFFLGLAHFKSGQTGLTKDQLQEASAWLEGASAGKWAITGDMNWDFNKRNELLVPAGAQSFTCWTDKTQVRGGILDWCLAASAVTVNPADLSMLNPQICDMQGPDHKPVIFSFT